MAPRCLQLGAILGEVRVNLSHLGPTCGHHGTILGHLDVILGHLGAILAESWLNLPTLQRFWVQTEGTTSPWDPKIIVLHWFFKVLRLFSLVKFMSMSGPIWGHLGPSQGILGPSCGPLKAILGHLGAILGYLGVILGPLGASWGHLGPILGHLAAILKPSWTIGALSWAILGPYWNHLGHLGAIWRQFRTFWADLGSFWDCFGTHLGAIWEPFCVHFHQNRTWPLNRNQDYDDDDHVGDDDDDDDDNNDDHDDHVHDVVQAACQVKCLCKWQENKFNIHTYVYVGGGRHVKDQANLFYMNINLQAWVVKNQAYWVFVLLN